MSSSLLSCSAISSQVTAGPTRNVTGDVMPLAEAITQLSFFEFLQRCGVPIAPLQPSQLPVPISLLDAAVQATPPCDAFQDVSTQIFDQQVSSLSFDVAVQKFSNSIHTSFLDAAVQTIAHSTLFQHVSTQMGSRPASSCSVDKFAQTPIRSTAIQLPITEFFTGCIFSNDPLDSQNFVRQSTSSVHGPRALLQPLPGVEQLAPLSGLAIDSFSLVQHTWRIHYSCTSTSPATFSYFSFASTATCLYLPCGNTSCTFRHCRQKKCQHCFGGNLQSCCSFS